MDPRLDKSDPVLVLGPEIIFFIILSEGADVHIEDGAIQIAVGMFLGNHGFLDRIHAADRRTVAVSAFIGVPGSDALKPGDFFGFFPVQRPAQVPPVRAGSAQDAFEFLAGDHVGGFAISQKIQFGRVISLAAGGQYDGADGQCGFALGVIILNGLGNAHVFTEPAADAGVGVDAECQGNGLRVFDEGGPSIIQPLVVAVDRGNRTVPGAFPAARAFDWIDVPGMVDQGDGKIPGLSFNRFDFAVGDDIDVQMPADLDQFG